MTNQITFSFFDRAVQMSLHHPKNYIQNIILDKQSFYEEDFLKTIYSLPIKEGSFIDIGANIGNHSIFFSKVMGRDVYAFEPNFLLFRNLLENLKINNIENKVKVYNSALFSRRTKAEIQFENGNNDNGKLKILKNGKINVGTLDSYVSRGERIALIKIDAKGFELEILKGAEKTIEKNMPLIALTIQDESKIKKINDYLINLDYKIVFFDKNKLTFICVHNLEVAPLNLNTQESNSKLDIFKAKLDKLIEVSEILTSSINDRVEVKHLDKLARHIEKSQKNKLFEMESKIISNINEIQLTQNKDILSQKEKSLIREISHLNNKLKLEREKYNIVHNRLKYVYENGPRALAFNITNRKLPFFSKFLENYKFESWEQYKTRLAEKTDLLKSQINLDNNFFENYRNDILDSNNLHISKSVDNIKKEKVRIGIAAIEIRQTALSKVIDSLYNQADEIYVYLNDFIDIPDFLKKDKITVIHGMGDVGDRGKFYGLKDFKGYYITCDDDIIYPSYYVKHLIDGIERYGRKSIVGWHGSVLSKNFIDYYSKESRRVYSFKSGRPSDIAVHILGTGCSAFHTSTIDICYEDFKTSNMADIYLALLGQKQKIPFTILKHDPNQAIPLDIPNDMPIHRESMNNSGSKADTKALQNKLVKNYGNWHIYESIKAYNRESYTIGYVGRINQERWKKGGILKSGHLLISAMREMGHRVIGVEIDQDTNEILKQLKDSEIVWIYPGDPERPDFENVDFIIKQCIKANKKVLVNLSYTSNSSRTNWITNKLNEWKNLYGSAVKACFFTNSILSNKDFLSLSNQIVCIPKSIDYSKDINSSYEDSEGIFLGDLQKLLNRNLVLGDIEEWINALKEELPNVTLYAVRQYGGKVDRNLDLKILPYTKGYEWEKWLSSRRIVCCLTPTATFEMIPVEAAGLGTPIVYRPMVHAHSEVLSFSGIMVDSPKKFAKACKALYLDKTLWNSYSNSLRYRAESQHIEHVKAIIHQQIALAWD